jgi:hypothetical protein
VRVRSFFGSWPGLDDPVAERTKSSTDVTNHKRATPKTILFSRETCCGLLFVSICIFMSISIDAPGHESVTAAERIREINTSCPKQIFFNADFLCAKYEVKSSAISVPTMQPVSLWRA